MAGIGSAVLQGLAPVLAQINQQRQSRGVPPLDPNELNPAQIQQLQQMGGLIGGAFGQAQPSQPPPGSLSSMTPGIGNAVANMASQMGPSSGVGMPSGTADAMGSATPPRGGQPYTPGVAPAMGSASAGNVAPAMGSASAGSVGRACPTCGAQMGSGLAQMMGAAGVARPQASAPPMSPPSSRYSLDSMA